MSQSNFTWAGPDRSEIHLDRTIAYFLKAPPPSVDISAESTAKGTGWHDDFATIKWEDIQEWGDFNNESIDALLQDVVRQPVPWTQRDEDRFEDGRRETYRIKRESDVNTMFQGSMVNVIQKVMDHACPRIRSEIRLNPVELETSFEGANVKIVKGGRTASASKQPDWPIYQVQKTKNLKSKSKPSYLYVAGEAKRDFVFKPEWLESKSVYEQRHAFVTLGQAGMYSYYGKTRYSFVITPVTLTVLRYHFISKDAKQLRLGVEYKVIPLAATGSQLTATKAIVSLVAMSMNDRQRDVVPKDQVMPLNTWYRHEANGSVVYAHILTERLEPCLPDSGHATSDKSILKLLSSDCYQAMQSSVGVPFGDMSQNGAKGGAKGQRLSTSTKSRRYNTRSVLKVVLEPKAKISKPKPKPARLMKATLGTEAEEFQLSPTSLDDLNNIIRNFKASRTYRGKMVIHHRVECAPAEARG